MANLYNPINGQTVNSDDPNVIQDFINRGFTVDQQDLVNAGIDIRQLANDAGMRNQANMASGVMYPTTYPPTYYSAPQPQPDVATTLAPQFQGLQSGQQGIMGGVQMLGQGQSNLAQGQQDIQTGIQGVTTGQEALKQGQGSIIANQGVLQGDVQNVGGQVSNVQNTIGTPTSTGQTVFSNLGGLQTGQQGIMGSIGGVSDALGQFRTTFDNYSGQATNQRDIMQKQALNQNDQLMKEVRGVQPAINQINQALPGYNATNPMAAQSYTTAPGVMAPVSQGINTGLTSVAQNMNNTNTSIGPQGIMSVDPRDFV